MKDKRTVHVDPASVIYRLPQSPNCLCFTDTVLTADKEVMREMSVIQPEWLLELAPHYYETRKSTHDVEMDSDIEEAVAHSKKERRKRSKRDQVRFAKLRPSPPPHVTRGF